MKRTWPSRRSRPSASARAGAFHCLKNVYEVYGILYDVYFSFFRMRRAIRGASSPQKIEDTFSFRNSVFFVVVRVRERGQDLTRNRVLFPCMYRPRADYFL